MRRRGRVRSRRQFDSKATPPGPLREPRDRRAHRRPRVRPARLWRTSPHRTQDRVRERRAVRGRRARSFLRAAATPAGREPSREPSRARRRGLRVLDAARRRGRRRPHRQSPLPTSRGETLPSIRPRALRPRTRGEAKHPPAGPESRTSGRLRPGPRTAKPTPGCTSRAAPGRRSRPSEAGLAHRETRGWPARSAHPLPSRRRRARTPQRARASRPGRTMWLPCQSERARRAMKRRGAGKNSPEVIRERVLPCFIDSFGAAA